MPIFMDRHFVPNVNARAVAEAHRDDMAIQDHYGCKCMTYWIDEDRGNIFCLIDAPDKSSVIRMHKRAHGLVPHEIIQVSSDVVNAFLGRIHDPANIEKQPNTGLMIFSDPAFRAILFTETTDYVLLANELGKERATALFTHYTTTVHQQIRNYNGLNIELGGVNIVGSFVSVNQAITCALKIQKLLRDSAEIIRLRLGLHAGYPVKDHEELFGNTLKLGKYLCRMGQSNQLSISSTVRDLKNKEVDQPQDHSGKLRWLSAVQEKFFLQLIDVLERSWQNAHFNVAEFSRLMGMSKSALYRVTVDLTGLSPNALLKDFRLTQSRDLLRKQDRSIAQTTFDTGFSSPSYFSKCFQKKFGMLPLAYIRSSERA